MLVGDVFVLAKVIAEVVELNGAFVVWGVVVPLFPVAHVFAHPDAGFGVDQKPVTVTKSELFGFGVVHVALADDIGLAQQIRHHVVRVDCGVVGQGKAEP